jgi:hypothetical protein
MSGDICKSREHERASRKMPGRKMKAGALIVIFLPDIFGSPILAVEESNILWSQQLVLAKSL